MGSFLADHKSQIGLLLNAILSDIADEQKHFHKPSWQSGLNSSLYVFLYYFYFL